MPQIWLTVHEINNYLETNEAAIGEILSISGRPKRKCSDGQMRVKLSKAMAHEYMIKYARATQDVNGADFLVSQLRGILKSAIGDTFLPDEPAPRVDAA